MEQKYLGGGVLPIIKTKNGEKYIVLVQRSSDAPENPGAHSGFFGGAETEKEMLNPDLAGARELIEELAITFFGNQSALLSLVLSKPKLEQETLDYPEKHFRRLWREERDELKNATLQIIEPTQDALRVQYREHDGLKRILIQEFELEYNLDDLILLDGEVKDELPKPKTLLNRKIDVFELSDFIEWWKSDTREGLGARYSYKNAQHIPLKSFIQRTIGKISPSLVLALNVWDNKNYVVNIREQPN